jgi:adenylate kinase
MTDSHKNVAAWVSGQAVDLAAREQVEAVDLVAQAMEVKWGVGRLRLAVGLEMREKFDRQRLKFQRALWEGPLETLRQEGRRMITAWHALDRQAEADGVRPSRPDAWEALLPDGSVLVVCRTDRDAAAWRQEPEDERACVVWSLEEVARLVRTTALALTEAKAAWPGAVVVSPRIPAGDAGDGAGDNGGEAWDDPIPF